MLPSDVECLTYMYGTCTRSPTSFVKNSGKGKRLKTEEFCVGRCRSSSKCPRWEMGSAKLQRIIHQTHPCIGLGACVRLTDCPVSLSPNSRGPSQRWRGPNSRTKNIIDNRERAPLTYRSHYMAFGNRISQRIASQNRYDRGIAQTSENDMQFGCSLPRPNRPFHGQIHRSLRQGSMKN